MKYKVNEQCFFKEIDNELIIISSYKDSLISVNVSAASILKKLKQEPMTEHEMANILLDEYEIDFPTALKDINKLINNLLESNVIQKNDIKKNK